jgi:hypothetical protein
MKLDWEFFIRAAFGLKNNNGRLIHRGGDPANMANNNYFNDKHLKDVIITTGYAMEILNQDVKNRIAAISDKTKITLNNYIEKLLTARSIADIEDIIDSYKKDVFDRFFKYDGIILSRK